MSLGDPSTFSLLRSYFSVDQASQAAIHLFLDRKMINE